MIDPACAVLHYAQEIFEGLKAYRLDDGSTALFRPEANARRFQESARRMAMDYLSVYRELMGQATPKLRVVAENDAARAPLSMH